MGQEQVPDLVVATSALLVVEVDFVETSEEAEVGTANLLSVVEEAVDQRSEVEVDHLQGLALDAARATIATQTITTDRLPVLAVPERAHHLDLEAHSLKLLLRQLHSGQVTTAQQRLIRVVRVSHPAAKQYPMSHHAAQAHQLDHVHLSHQIDLIPL